MAEIWDLVDENGIKTGIKWQRSDHDSMPEGVYHPCVEVWVKVGDKLLVTRRHPDKSEGMKYDLPGGAVVSGESLRCGAVRELYEEVGIAVGEDSLILLGELALGKVYAASYLIKLTELPTLSLQPSEVVGYRLVSQSEFESITDELTRGTYRRYHIYKDKIFG